MPMNHFTALSQRLLKHKNTVLTIHRCTDPERRDLFKWTVVVTWEKSEALENVRGTVKIGKKLDGRRQGVILNGIF